MVFSVFYFLFEFENAFLKCLFVRTCLFYALIFNFNNIQKKNNWCRQKKK